MKRIIAVLMVLSMLTMGVPLAAANETRDSDVEAMLPVLDSVMYAMIECNRAYSPDNSEYFWTTLAMIAVNWDIDNPLSEVVDPELRVPRRLMQEYAAAAFANYTDLLPVEQDGLVRYDEAWDAYFVGLGDKGDIETRISGYSFLEDGTVEVEVVMSSFDEVELYTMTASLEPNPYADAVTGGTYAYSVSEAILSESSPDYRIRSIMREGDEEEIAEVRYYSPYGYQIWYDPDLMERTSSDDDGYDEFAPIDPDALMPVSLTVVPVEAAADEIDELFHEAVADHRAGGWDMGEIETGELDGGMSFAVCEGVSDGVVVRLYLLKGVSQAYSVTAVFPEEATEGYGARLDIMVGTIAEG
ncbi:MAG: hypothetical protein Q4D04_15680 [Clostridia bacterium]|nr:hypothetical protein [Clostridia bacterium]